MKKLLNLSFLYFILAMAAGVFYREYTKFLGFTGKTTLAIAHTHLLVMGMFLFLLLALFAGQKKELLEEKRFGQFLKLYPATLIFMVVMMIVRGILQVQNVALTSAKNAMISGIAGISHILMVVSIVLLFGSLKNVFGKED